MHQLTEDSVLPQDPCVAVSYEIPPVPSPPATCIDWKITFARMLFGFAIHFFWQRCYLGTLDKSIEIEDLRVCSVFSDHPPLKTCIPKLPERGRLAAFCWPESGYALWVLPPLELSGCAMCKVRSTIVNSRIKNQ